MSASGRKAVFQDGPSIPVPLCFRGPAVEQSPHGMGQGITLGQNALEMGSHLLLVDVSPRGQGFDLARPGL